MNMIKKCFSALVSTAMCTAVLVQPFGDNLTLLKSEIASYAVTSENSAAEHYADIVMNNYTAEKSWQELYADELRNYMNSDEYSSDAMFDLYDIDNDSISELFISEGPQHTRQVDIYTIYQGELINLGDYGMYGYVGITDNNLMYCYDESQGYKTGVWYSLSDGNFSKVFSSYSDIDAVGEENATYKINDGIVTAEKYEEELSKYSSDDSISIGRKYTLDEETINSVFTLGTKNDEDDIIAQGTSGENITWKLTSDGTLFINGQGDVEGTIVGGAKGYPAWTPYNEQIFYTVIEDGITNIAEGSFLNSNLKEITIPDSVEYIGIHAFDNCSNLTSVVIPDNVETLSTSSFSSCDNLTDVTLGKGLKNIDFESFSSCSKLEKITIPKNVEEIGGFAFCYCSNLKSITIENPECKIYDDEGTISDTAVIYGYENSTAKEYAEKYGREFIAIDDETLENISGRYSNDNLYIDVTGRLNSEGIIRIEYVNDRRIRSIVSYQGILERNISFQENDQYGLNSYEISFNDGAIDISIHGIECTNRMEGWLIPDINETISKTADTIPDYDISSWSKDMIILAINNYLHESDLWNQYTVSSSDIDEYGSVLLRDNDGELTQYLVGWGRRIRRRFSSYCEKKYGSFLRRFSLDRIL